MTDRSPTPRDFRQEVTDNIIRLLEEGTAPWQKPWDAGSSPSIPMNPTTGKAYRGGNVLHLFIVAINRGYQDPRWMTYKQAQEKGWQIRKGEKGTQIEFWDIRRAAGGEQDSPEESTGKGDGRPTRMLHRVYTVFNGTQIDGIPAIEITPHTPFEAAEAGERILAGSGAAIHHDQADRAFYSRTRDSIHLPKREFFPEATGYYSTALHELAHWTGHPSRLDRPTLTQSYAFGDTAYAQEELRAEITSLFLAAERGIPHQPDRHAAYVGSWIRALQNDKNEIFRASADAAKATDYLLELERAQTVAAMPDQVDKPTPDSHVTRVQQRALELDWQPGR